jgi:pimeloyl-ACP methyl ester carboxylesterase
MGRTLGRFILAGIFCLAVGCARPILVVTVGGLGFSQMGTVRRAIEKQCPDADVKSAGFWDAFKTDVQKMLRESPHDHVVLIGHSLGCQTIAQATRQVKKVDLLVLIEPAGDDIRLQKNVEKYLWYQRTNFDWIRPAKISGASPTRINGGHNDIAQSPEVVNSVVKAINEIKIKR